MSATFVMPDNEEAGTAPPADAANPIPSGTIFTKTLADGELIANIPTADGTGFHRIGAGIGADPATLPPIIARTMRSIACGGA